MKALEAFLTDNHYSHLETKAGLMCGILPLAYTWGIVKDLKMSGYDCR